MPDFGYHFARVQAAVIRFLYRLFLPALVRRRAFPRTETPLPLEIFSYSNEAMLPEQVASIRSFIRHAGRPKQFTVTSDGTHSKRSMELLRRVDPCVRVVQASHSRAQIPEAMRPYLSSHSTGRQLALMMSLPGTDPALYVDADVLFFAGAAELSDLLRESSVPAHFLRDCQLAADDRLFRSKEERSDPVNTGFLLLYQPLDWSLGIKRFLELEGAPNFFTNQTITHLTMHANAAEPLDSKRFILELTDQCEYRDRYASAEAAMRHYVNPVRHKFWNSLLLS